jgi:hypothetical protein
MESPEVALLKQNCRLKAQLDDALSQVRWEGQRSNTSERMSNFLSEALTLQFTRVAGLLMFQGHLTANNAPGFVSLELQAIDNQLHRIRRQYGSDGE